MEAEAMIQPHESYHDAFAKRLDARRQREKAANFLLKLSTQPPAPPPVPARVIRKPRTQPEPEEQRHE
jgi:hypothetical protein